MHAHRPVLVLIVAGAFLGMPAASQAAVAAARAQPFVVATGAPVAPGSTQGTDTHVSVRVLPVPSVTPTSPPTSTPTQPATNPPTTGGHHGGNLPKTGTNSRGMFELGLGVVGLGALMMWLATMAFRRRRESMG